jgi:endo-1,4-beta-xylanase
MRISIALLVWNALRSTALVVPRDTSDTAATRRNGLDAAAKAAGKLWFGTAANIPGIEENDQYYMQELANWPDFGAVTPANAQKHAFTEPQRGVFNFSRADHFFDVIQNGRPGPPFRPGAYTRPVRCHALIWHLELPNWLAMPAVPWTNATLSVVLVNHVQALVAHFGDECYSWDVVNEALNDDGTYRNNSIWYNTIGPEYIAMAFQAAQNAVAKDRLKTKLYYNDWGIESPRDKSTAAQNMIRSLKARGIQIDGVGFESHFTAGQTPTQARQQANMNAFTALGLECVVSELDVRVPLPATTASLAQQAQDYYSTVAACVNVPRCVAVTVWDFVDTYSSVPSTFPGWGAADLFLQAGDAAGTPLIRKPAYHAVLRALMGHGPPTS